MQFENDVELNYAIEYQQTRSEIVNQNIMMMLFYAFIIAISIVLPILTLSIFVPKWKNAVELSFKDVVLQEIEQMTPNEQIQFYCLEFLWVLCVMFLVLPLVIVWLW